MCNVKVILFRYMFVYTEKRRALQLPQKQDTIECICFKGLFLCHLQLFQTKEVFSKR